MSTLVFTSNTGSTVKNAGGLKCDAEGYYKVILGTIGVPNSSGMVYEVTPAVRKLFDVNSPMIRRLSQGYLRAEQGHPKKLAGMSNSDYVRRILKIEEKSICGHIKTIELIEGQGCFTVVGFIKPAGPYSSSLKDDFENIHSNTAFSIRSLVDQRIENGVVIRTLKTVVTWDFVDSPGIDTANKTTSVGLEEDLIILDTSDTDDMEVLVNALNDDSDVGTESEQAIIKEVLYEITACRTGNCVYRDWK